MNVYPITFHLKNGTTVAGELVSEVSLTTDFWTLVPAGNGTQYSGFPAGNPPNPTWSTVPNLINETASLSVNILTTYITPTSGCTCVLIGSLPTGWSFNGTTLAYNGTSVNATPTTGLYFTATLTATGLTSNSNTFSVQGSGTPVTDTTAPTIPLAISAGSITQTTAVLTGYASSDPSPPAQTASGMEQYNVTVTGASGSPFTVSSPSGTLPVWVLTDVGSQTSTLTQTGADLAITTTAIDSPYPTNSAVGGGGFQLSGTSWIASCEIDAFSSGNAFDNLRLECRPSLSATDAYCAIIVQPFNHSGGIKSEARTTSGGNAANIVLASLASAPVRMFLQRSADTYSFFYSVNGNAPLALGTTTQVMGSSLYILFGGNAGAAGTVSGTIKQTNVETLSPWTLSLTGLTANTTYPVTVTAQDADANISAASASVSFTTSAASSGFVFPTIGVQGLMNNAVFPTANLKQLAQYQWILMGGNYYSWPSVNSAGGGYSTRDAVVQGLKSFSGSGGKNAIVPQVGGYQLCNDLPNTSPFFPEWSTAVANNNWYVYVNGSSGTKTASPNGNSAWFITDFCHVVGTDPSTGLYPGALAAQLSYNLMIAGTSPGGGSAMASAHYDFIYMDDFYIQLKGGGGDYARNGTNPAPTDPTTVALYTTGKGDFATQMNALAPSVLVAANEEAGYDMGPASTGALGIASSNMTGKFDQVHQQFMFGSSGGAANALSGFGTPSTGFATFLAWYQVLSAQCKTGGRPILSGGINSTDYQTLRYSLCSTLICGNGIFVCGLLNVVGSAYASDLIDPGNTSYYPVFDEFWGGTLNLAAYLGVAVDGPQTAAWSANIWRRRFANGWSLVNPTSSPVLATFGTTLYHMHGSQAPAINTGLSATSYTIPAYDAVIMLTSAPP